MYYLKEYHKDVTRLADLLLWVGLVHGPAPTVVQNKDGMLMATLGYQAPDVAMLGREQRLVYLQRLNRLLMRLGTGWACFADEWHEATTAYPESAWTNPTACFVDASRRALFDSGALHESQQFLTLCWQPPASYQHTWYEAFFTTPSQTPHHEEDTHNLDSFMHAVERFTDGLLGLWQWHWCSPDETLTYLHRCISWDRHPVGCPDIPMYLDVLLSNTDFLPGHTPQLGGVSLRPICVKTWPRSDPETGHGGLGIEIPAALQRVPFPYRFTVRWLALDKHEARGVLEDYQSKWAQQLWKVSQYLGAWVGNKPLDEHDPTQQQNEEVKGHRSSITRALRSLDADEVSYGYLTPTVLVWGKTGEEVAYREREVTKLLQQHDMTMVAEKVNAPQAWLGTLPGDVYHNVRKPCLPSLATAFLLPHGSIWPGAERDEHYDAPPLFVASSEGVPFRFALHPGASELGNTMVLGPSRSGKSGLLGFMMLQFLRYEGAQIFCFDKDYALYAATVLAGGAHYDLGGTHPLGLQPFGRLDEDDQERRWAQHWVQELVRSQGITLGPDDREQLWIALGRLSTFPRAMRTLSGYVELLQVQRLKPAFGPFLHRGPYSFLDADQDAIALQDWTTLEMRRFLDMPEVLPHVLRYQFHRMSDRFTGRPTLIVIDEARKLLADPTFGPEILDFLKERAKVNVSVILCTQEVIDAAETRAWPAIKGSVKTWLFLPNSAALDPSVRPVYQECGLTDDELHLLALSTPKQDYLYKSDIGVRRFQLHLSALERLLCAASTPEEIAALQALRQEELKEPLVAAWLRRQELPMEAQAFHTYYHDRETIMP